MGDCDVGRLLDALTANGLENNKPVVFTSDNGGDCDVGRPDINRPYRGWKPLSVSLIEVPADIGNPMRRPLEAGDDVVHWLDRPASVLAAPTGGLLQANRAAGARCELQTTVRTHSRNDFNGSLCARSGSQMR